MSDREAGLASSIRSATSGFTLIEMLVALAIFLHLYNTHGTVNIDEADDLRA